jgi:hypothetical protein
MGVMLLHRGMKRNSVALVLISLLFCTCLSFQDTNCTEDDSVIVYKVEVYHYWAVNFALINPPLTLSSPSLVNPYLLSINTNYRDEIYKDIVAAVRNNSQYKEELRNVGLKEPHEEHNSLFFYFSGNELDSENSSNYIKYNGKILVVRTTKSGELRLKQLEYINPLFDDIIRKIETVEKLITEAINRKFQNEIFGLKKFAPDKSWEVRRFDIFTEYVVDIRDTNTGYSEIDERSYEYLVKVSDESELEIYPSKLENQNHLELRRCSKGYSTNIIVHDGSYTYNPVERDDKFDMYIILNQIERICKQSLDILETLKNIPDEKDVNFLSEFEEQWKVLRDIQAFMAISTMYIEKHKAILEAEKGGKRWMIEDPYQDLCEIVDRMIMEANSKTLGYGVRYQTEKDLFLMNEAYSQYESATVQLEKTGKMLDLSMGLLILTIILVFFGLLTFFRRIHKQYITESGNLIGNPWVEAVLTALIWLLAIYLTAKAVWIRLMDDT